jgi:HEAT repeat protein
MLQGLDDLAWDALEHAYGSADDVPHLIRAAASMKEETADQAIDELFGSVFHQGTVYSASVAVVPFVAELAVTPGVHHRRQLVSLLGGMADPDDAYGVEVAAVRAAVAAEVPRLLPLLADPDPDVRETTAYALARCPEMAGPVVAAVRERWTVEDAPLVRGSLLAAGGRLDPDGCADWLIDALDDPHAAVRAAAALTIAWAGMPWPNRATDAVISAFRDGNPLYRWSWAPSGQLTDLLRHFENVEDVPATVLGALIGAPTPDARIDAVYAVKGLNRARRSAPTCLIPLLAPLLKDGDPAVRFAAAQTVRQAGSAGALVSDELAALAAACPFREETDWRDASTEALSALILLGDERWREPLLAAWQIGRAPSGVEWLLSQAGVACDPKLLAAVRRRFARIEDDPTDPYRAHNERAGLVWLLGSWGSAAAPALPELTLALNHGWGATVRALVAIGTPEVLPALRAVAGRGGVDAAVGVWRLAGDPEPLLDAVRSVLDDGEPWDMTIDSLVELGAAAWPLLHRLERFLTGEAGPTFPDREVQVAAARVVWRLTGDAAAVIPTIGAVLAAGDRPAGMAARLAGELGTHAQPLMPLLRTALDDEFARVDAAFALWRLGADPAGLVEPLLAAVGDPWGHTCREALDLLVEMRAAEAIPALSEFAEQDARLMAYGDDDKIVADDERLRASIRQAIERLQA